MFFTFILLSLAANPFAAIVITEVMANPAGGASDIPGDDSNEYIEFYNNSKDTVDLSEYTFTDGDAKDVFSPCTDTCANTISGTLLLPPATFCIVLDPEYFSPDNNRPYRFAEKTMIVTSGNTTLGDGLSNVDPVTLFHRKDGIYIYEDSYGTPVLSNNYENCDDDGADGIPFAPPAENLSVERICIDSADRENNWTISPPGGTPGFLSEPPKISVSGVRINEIMYYTNSGCPEWIEIKNISAKPTDLFLWSIGDGEENEPMSLSGFLIDPGEYAVIAEDTLNFKKCYGFSGGKFLLTGRSSWNSLRNDGDIIVIKNRAGLSEDSVAYERKAGFTKRGHSSERTLPTSKTWLPSTAGGTPGYRNSVFGISPSASYNIKTVPKSGVFSPDSDGYRDYIKIIIKTPTICRTTLTVFNIRGRKKAEIFNGDILYSHTLKWDGKSEKGKILPPGPYIMLAELRKKNRIKKIKTGLLIAP
ncbi:MAG: lamin tail domain-containing protein [Fibrobacterota bacterium]